MSIKTILTCDCGAKLELEGPYHTTRDAMKAAGWRNTKTDAGWVVKCKECRGK
jgi:hypothetical protein